MWQLGTRFDPSSGFHAAKFCPAGAYDGHSALVKKRLELKVSAKAKATLSHEPWLCFVQDWQIEPPTAGGSIPNKMWDYANLL